MAPAPKKRKKPVPRGVLIEINGARPDLGRARQVRFGSVVVSAPVDVIDPLRGENIKAGQSALARAKQALVEPGVILGLKPATPKYHVDPAGRLIRVLRGKRQVGKLVNGAFTPI